MTYIEKMPHIFQLIPRMVPNLSKVTNCDAISALWQDAILPLYMSEPLGKGRSLYPEQNGRSCFTRSSPRRKAREAPATFSPPSHSWPRKDSAPGPGCGSAPGCCGEAGVDRCAGPGASGTWVEGCVGSQRPQVSGRGVGGSAFALWIPCIGIESRREACHGALNQGGLAGDRLEPERGSG